MSVLGTGEEVSLVVEGVSGVGTLALQLSYQYNSIGPYSRFSLLLPH